MRAYEALETSTPAQDITLHIASHHIAQNFARKLQRLNSTHH